MKKTLMVVFILLISATLGYSHSNNSLKEKNTSFYIGQNNYKYVRTPTIYFVNSSGSYSKSQIKFNLVENSQGYLYIAYTTRYGTSYFPVYNSSNRSFKYSFYMNGWWYFN